MNPGFMDVLTRVGNAFRLRVLALAPRVLAALVVLGCGWLAAALVRSLVRRALGLARFDQRCERMGLHRVLRYWEAPWTATEVVARLAFWGTWACGAVLSLMALEIPALDHLVTAFFLFLPRLGVALAILLAGFMLAGFLSRAALLVAVTEEWPLPRSVAGGARMFVHLLAVAMALEQLGIAPSTVSLVFAITFGALMLALALAFGLGARDIAARYLEDRIRRDEQDGGRRHL